MSNNILFYCPCSGTKHYYDASALGTVSVYELGNGTRKTMANGVNGSYLRMPSNAINFLFENTMPTTLTIEWWQRNVGSYGCVIMPSNLLDGQKLQTQVRASVAQFQSIYFENRNGNLGDITLNNISNKEWTHIAYTQDYVNSRVYCHINGIYHGSAQTNNNQYAWKLLCIGAKSSNPESASEYFSGEIDEVIITAGVKYPHEQDFTPSTQLPSITDLAEGGDDETPEVYEYISNITTAGINRLIKAHVIEETNASSNIREWVGTLAEYEAVPTKDPNTLYHITDDTTDTDIDALNAKADLSIITSLCMPDYAKCIAGGIISRGTWIQVPKDSQVAVWGTDPYTENFGAFVSPDSGQTQYQVGFRYDDTNSNTEGTSFCFLVPKNWYFTCDVEQGFHYRIFPLKGAN